MDTPAEQRFDSITEKVKTYFNVPVVLISLVDRDRQWFKSTQGIDVKQTPRDISFCAHAINYEEILYVPDAQADERFFDNPLVTGDLQLRFYAGIPLHEEDGYVIGTLCLIDTQPRVLVDNDFAMLYEFAHMVEAELKRQPQTVGQDCAS